MAAFALACKLLHVTTILRAWLLLSLLCTTVEAGDFLETHSANAEVCFDGFVNWDFHKRQKLRSWKATALVIQRTFELWYPQSRIHSLVENGSNLRHFDNSCVLFRENRIVT